MHSTLFELEALLLQAVALTEQTPAILSNTDNQRLAEICGRLVKKADNLVDMGADRPLNVPVSALIL